MPSHSILSVPCFELSNFKSEHLKSENDRKPNCESRPGRTLLTSYELFSRPNQTFHNDRASQGAHDQTAIMSLFEYPLRAFQLVVAGGHERRLQNDFNEPQLSVHFC